MTDMDLVETSEIIPFHNSTSPIFNESIPRFFDRNQSLQIRYLFLFNFILIFDLSIQNTDEILYNYEFRLKALKFLQSQRGQNLQIMQKSYKKLEHMYDINSTITCFQLAENVTGKVY